uniref:MATE family efflux transporter n=1 Tax=Prevotella heparinolytica TaxID=28113 RepID=UPI0035A083E2
AMLGLYALTGWFIGMQNSRIPMYIAITQNIVNIIASLCLVYLCGMKVEGVALGTLIAQYAGFLMALILWMRHYGRLRKLLRIPNGRLPTTGSGRGETIWEKEAMLRFLRVNRDIFLRTLCLVAVTLFFTSAGASQGEIILAVNTLLMQLFTLFSYVMDGFAYAGEALSGRYIGARNRKGFANTTRLLFGWGAAMAALFTAAYATGGSAFLGLLTDDKEVIAAAGTYFYWALAIPVAGIAAFIWDGIFIGATATRGMLLSMATAAISFFVLYYAFRPALGNHALWLAFLVYLFMRGAVQTGLSRRVVRKAFASSLP